MARWKQFGIAVLAAACVTGEAGAQGVFDMGVLTGTLSQDAVTQAEEKRSHTGRYAPGAARGRTRTAAENCALRPQFVKKYGANHPTTLKFNALCRALGY